jgi:hypothetical protein
MLHPALARALVAAHIEDLQRAAARTRTIRLARRAVHEPCLTATSIAGQRSASTRPRGLRAPRPTARHEPGFLQRLYAHASRSSTCARGREPGWIGHRGRRGRPRPSCGLLCESE